MYPSIEFSGGRGTHHLVLIEIRCLREQQPPHGDHLNRCLIPTVRNLVRRVLSWISS